MVSATYQLENKAKEDKDVERVAQSLTEGGELIFTAMVAWLQRKKRVRCISDSNFNPAVGPPCDYKYILLSQLLYNYIKLEEA